MYASKETKCTSTCVHASGDTKCISTCVKQTPPMSSRTQNVSKLVHSKPFPCQQGHKIHHNICDQNTAKAPNSSHNVCQCVHNIHCWPNPSNANGVKMHLNTLWINPSLWTQKVSQHVFSKRIPSLRGQKSTQHVFTNPRPPAQKDKTFISTYVDHTHPLPGRT